MCVRESERQRNKEMFRFITRTGRQEVRRHRRERHLKRLCVREMSLCAWIHGRERQHLARAPALLAVRLTQQRRDVGQVQLGDGREVVADLVAAGERAQHAERRLARVALQ